MIGPRAWFLIVATLDTVTILIKDVQRLSAVVWNTFASSISIRSILARRALFGGGCRPGGGCMPWSSALDYVFARATMSSQRLVCLRKDQHQHPLYLEHSVCRKGNDVFARATMSSQGLLCLRQHQHQHQLGLEHPICSQGLRCLRKGYYVFARTSISIRWVWNTQSAAAGPPSYPTIHPGCRGHAWLPRATNANR